MKKFFYVFTSILLLIFVFLIFNGIFRSPEVVEKQVPGYQLMCMDFKGPYHEIGSTFELLTSKCNELGVKPDLLGIYLDNPETVAEQDLRSKACVIVTNKVDSIKLAGVGCTPYQLPSGMALTVNWSYSNMIGMMIGIFKSYAALGEKTKELKCMDQVGHVYERYYEGGEEFVFLKDNASMQPSIIQ